MENKKSSKKDIITLNGPFSLKKEDVAGLLMEKLTRMELIYTYVSSQYLTNKLNEKSPDALLAEYRRNNTIKKRAQNLIINYPTAYKKLPDSFKVGFIEIKDLNDGERIALYEDHDYVVNMQSPSEEIVNQIIINQARWLAGKPCKWFLNNEKILKDFFQNKYGQVCAVVGQTACGKLTQLDIVTKLHRALLSALGYYRVETGELLRQEIPKMSRFNKERLKEIQESGELQPMSLAVSVWTHQFYYTYKGENTIFVDGSPRKPEEVAAFLDAYRNYALKDILIFHVIISKKEAKKRSDERNRRLKNKGQAIRPETAKKASLDRKLGYYEKDVIPALKLIEEEYGVTVFEIDGMQPRAGVTNDIINAIVAYEIKRSNRRRIKKLKRLLIEVIEA